MRYLVTLSLKVISACVLGIFFSAFALVGAQSGTTGKIAFTAGGTGNSTGEIYVINSDGTGQTRLTNNGLDDRFPSWSPDGSQIVFESNRTGGTFNIFKMNADGTNPIQLTNAAYPIANVDPAWSPDGTRIAFVTNRSGDDKVEIWVMNADGTNPVRLTDSEPYDLGTINGVYSTSREPVWSPDGRKIAFSSYRGGNFNLDIYVMNADGSNQTRLTTDAGEDREATWSPDGTKIAFTSTRAGNHEVFVMNADGSNQTNITNFQGGNDFQPAWSPGGGEIAFVRLENRFGSEMEIYLMNVDGSGQTKITNNSNASWTPVWQPLATRALPTVQFSAATYRAGESEQRLTLTVTRAGSAAEAISVGFSTVDNPASISCDPTARDANGNLFPQGTAYARCDYATTLDTVIFAAGDGQPKTITIPLINDAHVEGTENFQVKLSNASGAGLGGLSTANVNILDDDAPGQPNPIYDTAFFVRMQYLDFLSREPETDEPWSRVLNRCPNVNNDPSCDRILVSQSFFGSAEFRLKGFFVYNFYRVAFGRLPEYAEVIADMRSVSGATAGEVYAKRAALPVNFIQRQEFKTAYDAMSNQQYVDTLLNRYNVQSINTSDPADPEAGVKVSLTRADLINRLSATGGAAALNRAQVLRAVVESDEVGAAEYNRAFVAMQYYGYLRRTPEADGYNAWLRVINEDPQNVRVMVNGFMNSTEYRLRFGQP